MIYLDTSVLLAFTLTRTLEPNRYQASARLFDLISTEQVKAATSFYALHELLVIAISNTQPDWETGSELARQALLAVLQAGTLPLPLPQREDKIIKARLFSALQDATDLPHALSAHTVGCTAIVAYDEHFRAISDVIPYRTPEQFLAEFVLDSAQNEASDAA